LIDRKGYQIAANVCKQLGKRLIVAGEGTPPEYGEYVGVVDTKRRGELMSKAQAVFVPTLYLEPFGGVAIEAMLCGTPVIATDWGAFTETVKHGVTGYRFRTIGEAVWAANNVKALKPKTISNYAKANYSLERVGELYQAYFEQLLTLWSDGWTTLEHQGVSKYRRYQKF